MKPIAETEIRKALLDLLGDTKAEDSLLIEELTLESGGARVDIALISDKLLGFEIKSDFDTLDRLSNQIHSYNRVFDEITLVAGKTFIDIALKILPSWWGLIEASRDEMVFVNLKQVRLTKLNAQQNSQSIASLLWKEEAINLLKQEGQKGAPLRLNKLKLYELIAQSVSKEDVKEWVTSTLRSRTMWRNSELLKPSGDLLHHVATSINYQ